MIYNENGMIINKSYILEDYFNNSTILSIINESFKDPKTKFGKGLKAAVDWLLNKVKDAIEWVKNIPNRTKIIVNKDKIKKALYNSVDNWQFRSIKIKGEISKYFGSDGYKNGGMWLKNFENAVRSFTQENKNLNIDQIKSILYGENGEENWFVNEKLSSYSDEKFDIENFNKIINFAINTSELSKPLKISHNELIKYNRKLDENSKIDVEVLNAINHYFAKAMSSIRNLSYACIAVCINALKNNASDSIEKNVIKKDTVKSGDSPNKQASTTIEKRIVGKDNKWDEFEKAKKEIEEKVDNMSQEEMDEIVRKNTDIDNTVKKYADKHEIIHLRYIFLDSLDVDPTFISYEKEFEYCRKNDPEMFEPYKDVDSDVSFSNNPSDWNDKYWINIKKDLKKNWSIKRFNHMKDVAKVVYKDKIERFNRDRREEYKKKLIQEAKDKIFGKS